MLVITRREGEGVVITVPGGLPAEQRIEIVVQKIGGDRARVSFEADRRILVHRREVQEQIDAGIPQRQAGKGPIGPESGTSMLAVGVHLN